MPCHPLASAKKPPAIGAATVATPFMPPMTANTPASSRAEYLSAAMERERERHRLHRIHPARSVR